MLDNQKERLKAKRINETKVNKPLSEDRQKVLQQMKYKPKTAKQRFQTRKDNENHQTR